MEDFCLIALSITWSNCNWLGKDCRAATQQCLLHPGCRENSFKMWFMKQRVDEKDEKQCLWILMFHQAVTFKHSCALRQHWPYGLSLLVPVSWAGTRPAEVLTSKECKRAEQTRIAPVSINLWNCFCPWEGLSSYLSVINLLLSIVSKYLQAKKAASLPSFKIRKCFPHR